jgi:hypothetical protein
LFRHSPVFYWLTAGEAKCVAHFLLLRVHTKC